MSAGTAATTTTWPSTVSSTPGELRLLGDDGDDGPDVAAAVPQHAGRLDGVTDDVATVTGHPATALADLAFG